jgi:hypothetical protein
VGDRRQELEASIDLAYKLARDQGEEVGVLADVIYGEEVAKASLALSDALQRVLRNESDPKARAEAWDLLYRLQMPILHREGQNWTCRG